MSYTLILHVKPAHYFTASRMISKDFPDINFHKEESFTEFTDIHVDCDDIERLFMLVFFLGCEKTPASFTFLFKTNL